MFWREPAELDVSEADLPRSSHPLLFPNRSLKPSVYPVNRCLVEYLKGNFLAMLTKLLNPSESRLTQIYYVSRKNVAIPNNHRVFC